MKNRTARNKWSKNRPQKPDVDPLLTQIVTMLQEDPRSRHAKANVSGLAPSTLKNWEMRKVRRPQSVSIQMAARALGYKVALVPDTSKPRN